MNFYSQHIGDYAKDAGHLSMTEDGAYRRLLDAYYTREKALPVDVRECCKLAKASTKVERDAVEYVLREFFVLEDDGHHQKRADEEIAKFKDKQAKAKKSANARWNSASEDANAMRTHSDGTAKAMLTHKPITNNQEKQDQKLESAYADLSSAAPMDALLTALTPERAPCPHQSIIALYHEVLPELRQVREWNDQRRKLLQRRWSESPDRQNLDWWRDFFGYVRKSRFLMGQTSGRDGRPFDCDLEWLIRPTNFVKVIEGKYEDQAA